MDALSVVVGEPAELAPGDDRPTKSRTSRHPGAGRRSCAPRRTRRHRRSGGSYVRGQADCIWGISEIARERSDYEGARAAYDQALALYHLYQWIPEPYSIGWAHRRLARIADSAG